MDSPAKNITVPRRESIESIYLSKQEIEQLKATERSLPFVKGFSICMLYGSKRRRYKQFKMETLTNY